MSSLKNDSKADVKSDVKSHSKLCILEAAAKLFSRLGVDRTSTREISKESKSNISLISYHFGGKEGLYKEVIKEFALKIQSQFSHLPMHDEAKSVTHEVFTLEVQRIVDHMIDMRLSHPEISVIMAREKIEGMPLSREIHEEIFYPLIKNFFHLFKLAQANKVVKADLNPALFFILLSEGIFGFYEVMDCKTSLHKDCEDLLKDKNKLKKQIVDLYLTGALI